MEKICEHVTQVESKIVRYASIVLEILDDAANENNVKRAILVDMFVDTLNALEQWKIQEE
jgi:hypothetical protein